MKHKCRQLKKILSMVLSVILIAGMTAGGVPIRAMAEEDVYVNGEVTKSAGENETLSNENDTLPGGDGTPSGGGDTLAGGDGTPAGEGDTTPGGDGTPSGGGDTTPGGDGTSSGTGQIPGNENETISNEEMAGADQFLQDTNTEYFQVNFYSDGVLQDTFEVKEGEKLSEVPEPVKEGYIFIGWAIAEENGEDFDSDAAITQTMDLYAKWEISVEAVLLEADVMPVAAQEASYSTDGGNTWNEGTFAEAVDACRSASQPAEIKLLQDISLTGSNWDGSHYLAGNSDVTIDGRGYSIIRGEGAGSGMPTILLLHNQASTVVLKDITIDGGAVWHGDDPELRTNVGLTSTGPMIYINGAGTLILEEGAVIQNNALSEHIIAGGAVSIISGKVLMKSGAMIRDNFSSVVAGGVYVGKNGELQMQGGTIHGNYTSDYGGGVYSNGTFIMTGGEISGNMASDGAGLCIDSSAGFQMISGSILNNNAKAFGGGISCLNGKVLMSGGVISGNISTGSGGGIDIRSKNGQVIVSGVDILNNEAKTFGGGISCLDGKVLMSGGLISGNKAGTTGGGVDMRASNGQMEISGGSILGNIAGSNGGGVFIYVNAPYYYNQIAVSGDPIITTNTGNGEAQNIFLENSVITLTGAMTKGALIGVTYSSTSLEAVFTSDWTNQMGATEKPEDYFSSDRSDYIVVKDSATNEAKLVSHVHNYGTDWKWDDAAHWHECDCGAKADQAAHTEDAGTIMKEPTETEAGEKVYKCTVCGHERIEILPATGGGSGDNKDDDENNQDGNGGSQGSSGGDQNNNVETGTNSINVSVQSNENAETAEIKVLNESVSAAVQAKEENASQKEAADGGTEPKTGEDMVVEVYATIAMIAGLLYLLSYFDSDRCGMTEAEKRELLTRIIQWSRKGGHIRTGLALAAIFLLLVYYHSIGKKAEAGWKEVYGE